MTTVGMTEPFSRVADEDVTTVVGGKVDSTKTDVVTGVTTTTLEEVEVEDVG